MSIVNVDCLNLQDNPHCPHGPTLKFSRLVKSEVRTFFACSAYRDRKHCPFFMWTDEVMTDSKKLLISDLKTRLLPQVNHEESFANLSKILAVPVSKRRYCLQCAVLFLKGDTCHSGHRLSDKPIEELALKQPSRLMEPLQESKKEAQFWFSKESIEYILSLASQCENLLCLGTPTVHEAAKAQGIDSVLMDIDHRYCSFYGCDEFVWFNMFNFHFMGDKQSGEAAVKKILRVLPTCLIIDPPFGVRLEALQETVKKFQIIRSDISIILVLPYFMVPKVSEMELGLKMLDRRINYTNHHKFKSKGPKGDMNSPVCIFSNIINQKSTTNVTQKSNINVSQKSSINVSQKSNNSVSHKSEINFNRLSQKRTLVEPTGKKSKRKKRKT